jgi:hypothetical protein
LFKFEQNLKSNFMKKIIGLSLFAVLAMVSCKKNESAEQLKIDSTQVAAQQAPVVSETSIIEETKTTRNQLGTF